MTYSIRFAEEKDLSELYEISRRVTNFNNRQFLPETMVDKFLASEEFANEMTDNLGTLKVILINNRIIGAINYTAHFLDMLLIDPEYQGTDAGYYLLDNTINEVLDKYKTVMTEVFNTNFHARKFYQRYGFKKYDEELIPGMVVKITKYRLDK